MASVRGVSLQRLFSVLRSQTGTCADVCVLTVRVSLSGCAYVSASARACVCDVCGCSEGGRVVVLVAAGVRGGGGVMI